jgi:AraC-like DNA-binding protein
LLYKEYKPAEALAPYVKCYYSMEYGAGSIIEDRAFATGCIEMMFTLQGSLWQTGSNGVFTDTSPIELWGQILEPLTFRVSGASQAFGIRFYPATAALFLREDISQFSDRIISLTSVMGNSVAVLHEMLQHAGSTEERIPIVDAYLLKKADAGSKLINKVNLVQQVMKELTQKDFFDNIENVASRYGITSRYLQKVFLHHSGITPKLYAKIDRFQNSLVLLGQGKHSLTSIAYTCGYFDQSHFIREFKSFTGVPPSAFDKNSLTAVLASANK